MFRTSLLQAPVITLLSPSVSASRRAASLISSILSASPTTTTPSTASAPETNGDNLDKIFFSNIPGLSRSWKSIGVACSVSGSVIHFCSLETGGNDNDLDNGDESTAATVSSEVSFSLLSITEGSNIQREQKDDRGVTDEDLTRQSIQKCRDLLAHHLSELSPTTKHLRLNWKRIVGGTVTPLDLLRDTISSDGLPLLSIENGTSVPTGRSTMRESTTSFLKEVVVPSFDYAEYKDGSTIFSRLSGANTIRPAVGVYQWQGMLTCIRPLPTAAEDQRLPPPSFIFHCEESTLEEDVIPALADTGIKRARIGYSGGMNGGQMMVLHKDLGGLDIRLCSRTTVSSAFSEAQQSLLAGSLGELQSTNVLLASGEKATDDDRLGKGDCWVELRANVKRPSGYFRNKKGGTVQQKIAKAPDLPYE